MDENNELKFQTQNNVVIEFQDVSKSFLIHHEKQATFYEFVINYFKKNNYSEKLQVLKNVSFEIKQGEIKTT